MSVVHLMPLIKSLLVYVIMGNKSYIYIFYHMELPIYNLLPRSNKQMCGKRRRVVGWGGGE